VNDVRAAATIISVLALILETVPSLAPYMPLFVAIEYAAVAIFTIEYVCRIIARKGTVHNYVFSFFGIIDLLAIVPTYLGLTNLTYLKTARVLRILRLLRMVRLAKLAQTTRTRFHEIEHHTNHYRLSLQIYFAALISTIILFGTLIYIAEGHRAEFGSIPLGMIWAAKATMGGVAQYMPETVWGELITIAARFSGLALFGLLLSIVGNALKKLLFGTDTV
jgi:voltage-gated potassium channel